MLYLVTWTSVLCYAFHLRTISTHQPEKGVYDLFHEISIFMFFFNKFILDFDESCLASNFIMAILGCHLQCRNRKIQYKEVKSVLCIRRPKNWSFSFGISPSNKYSELISFRINWFDLLAVQGTLKSYLQHHSSKASIIWCLIFFMGLFCGSAGKGSTCNAVDLGLNPGLGRFTWEVNGYPL